MDLRAKIVAAFDLGDTSTVALAERFQVSQPPVWRLINRYKNKETIEHKPHGGGQKSNLSAADHKLIVQLVAKDPTLTCENLAEQIGKRRNKKTNRWTVGKILSRLRITNKKISLEAEERHTPRVHKKRKIYRKLQKALKAKNLVFLDETGVNRLMGRDRGWAKTGQPAIAIRPINRRESTTVIGAMRQSGLVAMRSFKGGMKKYHFISFIKTVLGPCLSRGDVLAMDNLRSHHASEVRTQLSKRGVRILFLPPYSSDMNPIEILWSSLKQRFKSRFRRAVQTISRAIGGAWRSLRDLDLSPLLRRSGYRSIHQTGS